MKTLSIRQPYSHLIVSGVKDIENRTWRTNYRGPILIHAGLQFHRNTGDVIDYCDAHNIPLPDFVECGGIVGIAELIDVVESHDSEWFNGPYGFVLKNARPLPFFACKGKMGLFEVEMPLIL